MRRLIQRGVRRVKSTNTHAHTHTQFFSWGVRRAKSSGVEAATIFGISQLQDSQRIIKNTPAVCQKLHLVVVPIEDVLDVRLPEFVPACPATRCLLPPQPSRHSSQKPTRFIKKTLHSTATAAKLIGLSAPSASALSSRNAGIEIKRYHIFWTLARAAAPRFYANTLPRHSTSA